MGHKRIGKDDDGFKYAMVSIWIFYNNVIKSHWNYIHSIIIKTIFIQIAWRKKGQTNQLFWNF